MEKENRWYIHDIYEKIKEIKKELDKLEKELEEWKNKQ